MVPAAYTWTLPAASTALIVDVVHRPAPAPHTIVFEAGFAAPLTHTVRLPLPFEAFTSSTVSATAVAPTGTPELFTLQSIGRGVAPIFDFGPCGGDEPTRES